MLRRVSSQYRCAVSSLIARSASTWRCTVPTSPRDTGPGMPIDVLPHVFEPFFTTREGGLGLGLSLSESMAHAMGGTLTAFNQTPHGAEFRLSLPLSLPH